MLSGRRSRYYLFWQGSPEGVHRVDVLVSEDLVSNVVEMKLVSVRLMIAKLVIGKSVVNVISAYEPQIGRSAEEKDNFGDAVCDLKVDLKMDDIVVFVGDLNGHIGKRSDGYGKFHGGQS